jgi:hypothetical protein
MALPERIGLASYSDAVCHVGGSQGCPARRTAPRSIVQPPSIGVISQQIDVRHLALDVPSFRLEPGSEGVHDLGFTHRQPRSA